jgi:YD repeat-containing protein
MMDASGTTNYTQYDNRDRLLTKQTPEGTLTYTYDAQGNVLTINSSNTNGASVAYQYDVLNRPSSVTDYRLKAQGASSVTTAYSYDATGNLTGYTYPNNVQTADLVDPLNRLTQTCSATGAPASSQACSGGTRLSSYAYTLGLAGNRTAVAELGGRNVAYRKEDCHDTQETGLHMHVGGVVARRSASHPRTLHLSASRSPGSIGAGRTSLSAGRRDSDDQPGGRKHGL